MIVELLTKCHRLKRAPAWHYLRCGLAADGQLVPVVRLVLRKQDAARIKRYLRPQATVENPMRCLPQAILRDQWRRDSSHLTYSAAVLARLPYLYRWHLPN